jgi:Reverse transcriptase (RNA-dependent DNA polymerase)
MHNLLPPPSVISGSSLSRTSHHYPIPHTSPTPLPTPAIADVVHNRDLITRTTRSATNSLPKPTRHYNDIDSVSLFISLNTVHDISPPTTPDFSTVHTSLLNDCFLSAPFPFLHNRPWDLMKPPNSYHEASTRPDNAVWSAAMQRELDSLESRKAFERTTLPPGRKAIGLRWTYDYKYNPDGTIIRGKEKARLVAQGFSQRPEDYGEMYAPVVKLSSVRLLLAFANHFNLEIMSFDVKTAFLHAHLPYDIFVKQIPGYPEADISTVLRLLVALYGLKQAAYEWYKLLSSILTMLGLSRCEADHAVFVGRWTTPPHLSISMPPSGEPLFLIIPIHVDDGLAVTNSLSLYHWFVSEISKSIEFINLGPVINTRYLGQRIIRDRDSRTLRISQSDLIISLLEDWGLHECKTSNVPLQHNPNNLPPCSPNACQDIPDDKILISYQRLVGSITYLAICTRPDIAYAAMALGQFNASPTRTHLSCAKGVLRYLAGTVNLCLQFPSASSQQPLEKCSLPSTCGLSDADWASDEKDRKSISGYCFYFLNSLVSWSSRKQRTVSTSSTESEYYALTNTIKEAIWIKLFLSLTKLPSPIPFPILCDNQSTCTIANTDTVSSRTKHIDVRHHFIRQHITDGSFTTIWIPTNDMTADIFTKPLSSTLFLRHRENLGLILP